VRQGIGSNSAYAVSAYEFHHVLLRSKPLPGWTLVRRAAAYMCPLASQEYLTVPRPQPGSVPQKWKQPQ
jgi:hypothetical protein